VVDLPLRADNYLPLPESALERKFAFPLLCVRVFVAVSLIPPFMAYRSVFIGFLTLFVVACGGPSATSGSLNGEASVVGIAEETKVAEALEVSETADSYAVDTDVSVVSWTARNVLFEQNGEIGLREGAVFIEDGVLAGGSFTLDMGSISDNKDQEELVEHLKSADFFNVVEFPTGSFDITGVEPGDDENRYAVTGNLTIKDETHAVTFDAVVRPEGDAYVAWAELSIDRTLWDITFNSGSFFKDLGDYTIEDEIRLGLSITTKTL
jgi:polyisoprenoid-binding protein YceI